MKTLIFILVGITIALTIADFIILHKYCTAGFGGYPDEWSSDNAEKAHYIIAPVSLAMAIIANILCSIYLG